MADACPICGAPGGTCPNDQPHVADVKETAWHPPAAIQVPGDVVAAERIWRTETLWGRRKRRVVAYGPGQLVPREEAERLGVGPDGRQGDRVELEGTDEPALETPPGPALEGTEAPELEEPEAKLQEALERREGRS